MRDSVPSVRYDVFSVCNTTMGCEYIMFCVIWEFARCVCCVTQPGDRQIGRQSEVCPMSACKTCILALSCSRTDIDLLL